MEKMIKKKKDQHIREQKRLKLKEETRKVIDEYFSSLENIIKQTKFTKDDFNKLYESISTNIKFKKYLFDEKLYPRLNFDFSYDEVSKFLENKNGKLYLTKEAHEELKDNSLAKLFYAVLWKNGELNRFSSLVSGIQPTTAILKKSNNYVFRQFGKHLVDRSEPIVDKNTIRAYKYFFKNTTIEEKTELDIYLKWINQIKTKIHDSEPDEALYVLDKIMFTLGKALAFVDSIPKKEKQE